MTSGALIYKNWLGAPTEASNKGAIGDNFLAKKGVIGWQIQKWGLLGVKLHKIP